MNQGPLFQSPWAEYRQDSPTPVGLGGKIIGYSTGWCVAILVGSVVLGVPLVFLAPEADLLGLLVNLGVFAGLALIVIAPFLLFFIIFWGDASAAQAGEDRAMRIAAQNAVWGTCNTCGDQAVHIEGAWRHFEDGSLCRYCPGGAPSAQ